MNDPDRTSHFPIYTPVTEELLMTVLESVREATVEGVESDDGLVAYFIEGLK